MFGGDEDPHPCRGCGLRCTRGPLRARDCHHVVVPGLWGPSPTPDGTVVLWALNTPAARCHLRERARALLLADHRAGLMFQVSGCPSHPTHRSHRRHVLRLHWQGEERGCTPSLGEARQSPSCETVPPVPSWDLLDSVIHPPRPFEALCALQCGRCQILCRLPDDNGKHPLSSPGS